MERVSFQYLLVTDLDNTLVGDDRATEALNQWLEAKRSQVCFVYATGRSYASTWELITEKNLLEPDYLIAGVGSEIYQQNRLDESWAELISTNWDRREIAAIAAQFPELEPQLASEQNPWKISYFLKPESALILSKLPEKIAQAGFSAQLIYSSDRDLDILPKKGNKGNAVTYLQKRLQIQSKATIVCGDSGNDISLFEQNACGVIVGNAQSELLKWYREFGRKNHYLAHTDYAWGIQEGIKYFWGVE